MTRRLRVLMDVDDVLADFTGHYVELAYKATDRFYFRDQVTGWDIDASLGLPPWATREIRHLISQPGAAHRIPECEGAVDAVKALAKVADVVFVTAPLTTSKTWAHDRTEWLIVKFGPELGNRVIHTEHKECIAGDVFVDDKPGNVKRWSDCNPTALPFLWDQPSNRSYDAPAPIRRVSTWDVVTDAVAQLLRHNGR